MNVTTRFWTRLLPALLLVGSLGLSGSPAHAAPPAGDEAPFARVDPGLLQHLRTEMRDRDPDRREKALVDVVALAACQSACTVQLQSRSGETVRLRDGDLTGLGPALLRVYRAGPTDAHRLLALSALMNVGDEASIDVLVDKPAPVSYKLARTTQRHLSAFYLDRYPELRRQVRRTGTLSLDDVKIARDRHERILRREARRG